MGTKQSSVDSTRGSQSESEVRAIAVSEIRTPNPTPKACPSPCPREIIKNIHGHQGYEVAASCSADSTSSWILYHSCLSFEEYCRSIIYVKLCSKIESQKHGNRLLVLIYAL